MKNATNPELARKLYAMYLRKSRADLELEALGEGETLAKHRTRLYTLAEQLGIAPSQIVVYQEIVSGESIQDRPEMLRLLDDVYAKKYAGVLVVEVERLARGNTRDQGEVSDAFTYSDTKILTPVKIYDPQDEYDQEYFEFGLFMSRREYKTHQRRLAAGRIQSVKAGNYLPAVTPYGYDAVKKGKNDRYLVEKPDEARIVRMIFDWYTEDRKPIKWIVQQLNLMGVPTRKGGPWQPIVIKHMLLNVHYTGKVSWGSQKTVKERDPYTGRIVKKLKHDGTQEIYEGKHEAIVSEEQFNKAKAIYGTGAPVKVNTEMKNPLCGILRCASCGRIVSMGCFSGTNTAPRFAHTPIQSCKKPTCKVSVVMDALIDTLKLYISDYEFILEHGEKDNSVERHAAMIENMEAELIKLQRRKSKLMDSWESDDGMYTREEYLERKHNYNERISSLVKQIEDAKKNAPTTIDYASRIVTLHAVIDCINAENISAKEKNIFLRQFIEKITYDVINKGRDKKVPVLEVFLK